MLIKAHLQTQPIAVITCAGPSSRQSCQTVIHLPSVFKDERSSSGFDICRHRNERDYYTGRLSATGGELKSGVNCVRFVTGETRYQIPMSVECVSGEGAVGHEGGG